MFGPLGADKYSEYSRDIRESGQYLLDVINDILDMSKIEAGGIRLDARRRSISIRFSPTACAWCRQRASEKQLKLQSARRSRDPLQSRPPRDQADRAQSALQRREIHARTAARHRARPHARRQGHHRHRGHRHRHSQGRAAQARPAVRAGRKPVDQDAIRARASASPSPNRWSSCTAAPCASARRLGKGTTVVVRLPIEAVTSASALK